MLEDALALLKAWQAPLTLLLVFFGPSLLRRTLTLLRPSTLKSPPPSRLAKLIVLLHLIYAIYTLLSPPYDIFTTHNLRITTPTDVLRPLVSRAFGLSPTPTSTGSPLLDLLLVRLSNLDARLQYARWGHKTFSTCAWCRSPSDYALAALPSVLAPYLLEVIVIGALGWKWVMGHGAQLRLDKYRSVVGWSIVFLAGAEYAARAYWEMWVSKGDCLHLATVLFKCRTVVLWLLTAGYVLLPIRPTRTQEVNFQLLSTLDSTYTTLNLAGTARRAVAATTADMSEKVDGRQWDREQTARFVSTQWDRVVRYTRP